jgi:hypothetical protein
MSVEVGSITGVEGNTGKTGVGVDDDGTSALLTAIEVSC